MTKAKVNSPLENQVHGRSMAQMTWHRLLKNQGAGVGMIFIVVLVGAAVAAGFLYDYDLDIVRMVASDSRQPPSAAHWFGTDTMGRDIFARVLYGARYSLIIGVGSVMLGRGLIGDPGMLSPKGTDVKTLLAFYDELLEQYTGHFGGAKNAMFRLKENWRYFICRFENAEKLGKRLKKTTDVNEYRAITHEIIQNCPMRKRLAPDW